jgi:predicted acyl esterase
VEWVGKQSWCNGKIGTFGGSAVGITQLLLAGSGARNVTCQHITVADPSLYHGIYPGGVFKKALIEDWLRVSKFSSNALAALDEPPGLRHLLAGPRSDRKIRQSELACLCTSAAGSTSLRRGTIDAFVGCQSKGGLNARGRQKLIMGPWTHGVLQEKAGELKISRRETTR